MLARHAKTARTLAPLLASARAVVLAARGSSDHAAIYGRYLFETRNHLLTSLAAPSAVTLYGAGPELRGTVVIAVSQSGQGADVVAYLRAARAQGAATLAIVNDPRSPLAQAAEHVIDTAAGEERSVPATKTVLAQMAAFALLSYALSGADPAPDFEALQPALQKALAARPDPKQLGALARATALSVIGRGLAYPVALELALKLKETSDTRAESFSAADFQHGPIALIDEDHPALLIDVGGRTTAPAQDTAQRVTARGARAYRLTVAEDREALISPSPTPRSGPARHAPPPEALAPLIGVVLGQRLALALAEARGIDPAAPRGLSKVTSTH